LKASGSGFFGLLKFKIGFEAFKSWALITGLKICKKNKNLLHKSTKFFFRPFGPESGLKGSIFVPVGLCPIFRPFGLGLRVLFSKKPEPEPDLWARAKARPTSIVN
jgi:hypothetical protein